MDTVKIIVPKAGQTKDAILGIAPCVVHPETNEPLHCQDIVLNMPLDGVITAQVTFIVSEIVVGGDLPEYTKSVQVTGLCRQRPEGID